MAAYESWHVEVMYSIWTDITADVDTVRAPVRSTTGSSPEVSGDPSSLTLTLNNRGFKYTPGNTLSTFALTSGQQIRFFETISGNRYYLFTGFIEFPEIDSVNISMTQDQTIAISAVDQLSRWERSKTLVGTLAEHIVYAGGSELKGYFTLCDEAAPFQDLMAIQGPLKPFINYPTDWATATSKPTITYQGGAAAPGDDLVPVLFTSGAGLSDYGYVLFQDSVATRGTFANGEFLTVVFWTNFAAPPTGAFIDEILLMAFRNGADVNLLHCYRGSSSISVSLLGGTLSANILTSGQPFDTPIPIGIQVGIGPNSLKLWVGDVEYTTVPTGSPASPQDLSAGQIQIGALNGSVWHFQIYTGATYNRTKFLAQREVGNNGNARQTTGDRIKMLARYAGKTDADLTNVDTGGSIMQPARLAGKTIAEAMYEARDTEQGDLYMDGSGLLTFDDRKSLLNI